MKQESKRWLWVRTGGRVVLEVIHVILFCELVWRVALWGIQSG